MPCRLAEQAGVLRRESKTSVFIIRVIAGILVFAAVSSPGVAQEKGNTLCILENWACARCIACSYIFVYFLSVVTCNTKTKNNSRFQKIKGDT